MALIDNSGLNVGSLFARAIEGGDLNSAARWLQQGADVNYSGRSGTTPLMKAIQNSDADALAFLLQNGADVNAHEAAEVGGNTALHYASCLGDTASLRTLSKHKDDPPHLDAVNALGHTALIAAAREGHVTIVRFLLGLGASADVIDSAGWTAYTHAKNAGHDSVAQLLPAYEYDWLKAMDRQEALNPVPVYFKKKKKKRRKPTK